jgi:hypothetical protein
VGVNLRNIAGTYVNITMYSSIQLSCTNEIFKRISSLIFSLLFLKFLRFINVSKDFQVQIFPDTNSERLAEHI